MIEKAKYCRDCRALEPLRIIFEGEHKRLYCPSCQFTDFLNPTISTATLVSLSGGLVLVRRKLEPAAGLWCLPGGHVECGEDLEESAAREVLEETGLTVSTMRLLHAASPPKHKNVNIAVLFYKAASASGILTAGDDAIEAQVFFNESELPPIAFDSHKRMIKAWFANLLANESS